MTIAKNCENIVDRFSTLSLEQGNEGIKLSQHNENIDDSEKPGHTNR